MSLTEKERAVLEAAEAFAADYGPSFRNHGEKAAALCRAVREWKRPRYVAEPYEFCAFVKLNGEVICECREEGPGGIFALEQAQQIAAALNAQAEKEQPNG